MRKLIIKLYRIFGIKETENWTTIQLWFGQNYLGVPLLITIIFIILSILL